MRILIGLVALAALAYVGFQTFRTEEGRRTIEDTARQASEAAGEATKQAGEVVRKAGEALKEAALTVGGVDLGAELKGFVDSASGTLANVRDQASAEAARPNLEAARAKLDGFAAQVEQLPAAGRAQLASAVNASLPTLKDLSARLDGSEGGRTLKPTLDAIIARLEGWAKAPA